MDNSTAQPNTQTQILNKDDLKAKFKEKRLAAMPFIGKSICDFCVEHEIKNVVFLDRSARPAYQAFKEQWVKNYGSGNKDESKLKRPNIYFLSPKIMEETGVSETEVYLFKKEQPYLSNSKNNTLIFDVCVKQGLTLHNVKDLLHQSGFEKVYSMVTAVHQEKKQHFVPDKVLFQDHNLGCHLFGAFYNKEIGVQRNNNSFLADINFATMTKEQVYSVKNNRDEIRNASKK